MTPPSWPLPETEHLELGDALVARRHRHGLAVPDRVRCEHAIHFELQWSSSVLKDAMSLVELVMLMVYGGAIGCAVGACIGLASSGISLVAGALVGLLVGPLAVLFLFLMAVESTAA